MQEQFLSRFTPSLMQPEALEETFVQREKLAANIVERIAESGRTASKHHTLLVGPRGIGKTHLTALVYHRARALPDFDERFRVAWLREEEWGITSFLDLLMRILRALHEEYDDAQLVEDVEALFERSPEEAEQEAARLLREYADDRTLLIMVENLKDVFDGLGETGQQKFRAYLQEHAFCTILATAQSLFDGVSLRTSPFYGFFRVHHLQELSLDEAAELLTNIARWEGDDELVRFIQTPQGRARLRAVHHLGGGNPRVYVILSEFLTRESLNELVEPFMKMLDDLTPYYQARMSRLSPQQRKIVEFLVDTRGAASVKKIAARCFVSHQTASGQLRKLRELGYVQSRKSGRASYYELREPLMRFCLEVKKQRGAPIRLFVELLRIWYSETELQQQIDTLEPEAEVEREYLLRALRMYEEEEADPRVARSKQDCAAHLTEENYEEAVQAAEELIALRGDAEDWSMKGACHYVAGQDETAEICLREAIEKDPLDASTYSLLGHVLNDGKRYEDALEVFDKAIELDEKLGRAWLGRGTVLRDTGRIESAIASLRKATELIPEKKLPWLEFSRALLDDDQLEEAEKAARSAVEVTGEKIFDMQARKVVVDSLLSQNKPTEALKEVDEALEIYPEPDFWMRRGRTMATLERPLEALESFENGIAKNENHALSWRGKGMILHDMGRWSSALPALQKAFEMGEWWEVPYFHAAECAGRLRDWNLSLDFLDQALQRSDERSAEKMTPYFVWALFESQTDAGAEYGMLPKLVEFYENHDLTHVLGGALLVTAPDVVAPSQMLVKEAKAWSNAWHEVAGELEDFQLSLRLLDAAIEYRETEDERVLLELPAEQRELLESVLELSEGDAAAKAIPNDSTSSSGAVDGSTTDLQEA